MKNEHSYFSSKQVEVQTQETDQVDFSNNFIFGYPIYFTAFLTEVISQTTMTKETNKNINLFQVISNLAKKRLRILTKFEQLKSLILWPLQIYNEIVDPFKTNLLFYNII